ncbi:hypothetical protein, partial [Micromonospora echinaurantiaca]|uniref:hypothetical protein n=1 Tax=Micromonospora echinaurantiaca TaxID=47857 RepID=UPI0037B497B1
DLAKDGATSICEAGQTSLVRAPPDDKINENLQVGARSRPRLRSALNRNASIAASGSQLLLRSH